MHRNSQFKSRKNCHSLAVGTARAEMDKYICLHLSLVIQCRRSACDNWTSSPFRCDDGWQFKVIIAWREVNIRMDGSFHLGIAVLEIYSKYTSNSNSYARKTAQCLRALAAPVEGQGSNSSTHTGQLKTVWVSRSRASDYLFWPSQAPGTHMVHVHTGKQILMHINTTN